jgi:TATA-box binding protein (TBP) (component of TFIID and TFIIIB)
MSNFNWEKYQFIDHLNVKKHEVNNLPKGVIISTMCASCKDGLGTNINTDNILKYMQLNNNDIISVKRNAENMRSLIPPKVRKRKTKKVKEKKSGAMFFHQITVVVRVNEGPFQNLEDEAKINFKIFKNGSIQMSGIKKISYLNKALNKLLYRLRSVLAIRDKKTGKIEEINFLENSNDLTVRNFKIDMINSNYQVNMVINRDKLYNLLLKMKVKASYEKCIRACVIIKYTPTFENPNEKDISIFVFQKGNIIITGAKSRSHVISSYKYINDILVNHADEISKDDEKKEEEDLLSLYDDVIKENSHKLEELYA